MSDGQQSSPAPTSEPPSADAPPAPDAGVAEESAAGAASEPEPEDRYSEALRRFSGDVRMARQVWQSMAERGVERRPLHHRLWLDVLLAANDVQGASAQLDAMRAAGMPVDPRITWRLALARARTGDAAAIERLEELVRSTPPPADVLPRLFGLQVRAGRLGPARATMRRMTQAEVAGSNDDYRPLLGDIMDRRAIKDAEALVEHLLAVGAPPSEATAARLVTMMAEAGHVDRGEQLVDTLVAGGVAVRHDAREALVTGWAKADDLKAMRRAITALRDAGGTANSHHRNLVLGIIAGNGDLEGAWREALDIAETGIPSGDNLDRMLELALKRRDIALSLSAWDWMVMLGVPPAPNRAADLVGVVLRDGQLDLAMELYREVIRLEVTPDRRRGEELAAALVRAGRLDQARSFLNELRVRNVLTRGTAWGPLLVGLVRTGQVDEAVKLVEELAGHGMPPTVTDGSRLVDSLTGKGDLDRARTVLSTLAAAGVTVGEPTHRELLWAYARKGRAEEAKAVLDLMTAAGITPDERHEKAIAWATGETQRRLPDATSEDEEAAGDAIVAAKQGGGDERAVPDADGGQAPAPDTSGETLSQPATPQPATPQPASPQPVTPEPGPSPQPVTPEPAPTPTEPSPQPLTPEPAPVEPRPAEPEPSAPPVVPEPTVPEPEVPEPMPTPSQPAPSDDAAPLVGEGAAASESAAVGEQGEAEDVLTASEPLVTDDEDAAPESLPDPDPAADQSGDEDATMPEPITAEAHEQAPERPDTGEGTAAPDPAKDPTSDDPASAEDAIEADKLA